MGKPITKNIILILALILFLIISSGCLPIKKEVEEPFKKNCDYIPSPIYLSSEFDFGSNNSKYVYILVDQSKDYLFTAESLRLIEKEIFLALNPGDRIVVRWIGMERTSKSIIFDQRIERIPRPKFPTFVPTPILTPTLTWAMTHEGLTVSQGLQNEKSELIEKNNNFQIEEYHCQIGNWNYSAEELYERWVKAQEEEISEFINSGRNIISPYLLYENNTGKLLYETIYSSSAMLQSSIRKRSDDKYFLIIFSDMKDWRPEIPDDLIGDLRNVEVVVVSFGCNYEIECNVQYEWEKKLSQFHAEKPKFLTREDNISTSIRDFLRINP